MDVFPLSRQQKKESKAHAQPNETRKETRKETPRDGSKTGVHGLTSIFDGLSMLLESSFPNRPENVTNHEIQEPRIRHLERSGKQSHQRYNKEQKRRILANLSAAETNEDNNNSMSDGAKIKIKKQVHSFFRAPWRQT
jgi:hypothetical protein